MSTIKKMIPVWIKAPTAVFLREAGKLPFRLTLSHMYYSFTQNCSCSEKKKVRVQRKNLRANYAYLTKRYKNIVTDATSAYTSGVQPDPAPVWVFWWQGEKEAPEIIRRCISSVCRNANTHPVHIINKDNYRDFVEIPAHIAGKLENGTISLTHFSDFLRMALLYKYGGLWVDASVYVQQTIAEIAFELPVFTIRNPGMDFSNISNWEWTVGVFGGWKGHILFHVMEKLLCQYWQDFDFLLDYYVFDYMVKLVYDTCPAVRSEIQAIPSGNSDFYFLQNNANAPAEQHPLPVCDTWLFKLSWKGLYEIRTADGKETVYAQWLKESEPTAGEERCC